MEIFLQPFYLIGGGSLITYIFLLIWMFGILFKLIRG